MADNYSISNDGDDDMIASRPRKLPPLPTPWRPC